MGLVPGDFHGGNRAEIQAVNERGVDQLVNEARILRKRSNDQRWSDLLKHVTLGHFDYAGIRTKKLAVRQRMSK